MTRALAAFVVVAACGGDIRLGGPAIDAAIDAPGASGPCAGGVYSFTFMDPPQPTCTDALGGHEAEFTVVTRAQVHLVDGTVSLTGDAAHAMVSGAPIQAAFAQASITLTLDPDAGPQTRWTTLVSGVDGTGPSSTSLVAAGLALDGGMPNPAGGIPANAAFVYQNVDMSGACGVAFSGLLVRN